MEDIRINDEAIELLQNKDSKKWNALIRTMVRENPESRIIINNRNISYIRSLEENFDFTNVMFVECAIDNCRLTADFSKAEFVGCRLMDNLFVCSSFKGTVFRDGNNKKTHLAGNEFNNCVTDGIIADNEIRENFENEAKRWRISGYYLETPGTNTEENYKMLLNNFVASLQGA